MKAAPETKIFLDREGLLALADRVIEELHVPEWHGHVRIGSWDGGTRWKVIRAWPSGANASGDLNLLALVAAYSLVDESGALLYTEKDVPALAKKNARALDRIMTVALRINGLDAGAVDALGKDSAPAMNGGSISSLAAHLGLTVADLLARISSEEISEWQAYAALRGGLRDRRADVNAAQLCTILANVNRRKGAPPFRVVDFMPPEPEAEPARPARQPMDGLAALLRNTTKD